MLVKVAGCIARLPLVGRLRSTVSITEKAASTNGLMYSTFIKRLLAPLTNQLPNAVQNALRLERLDDEVFGSGLDGLDHHALLAHCRAHDDLCGRVVCFDCLCCMDSVHYRHCDVHQD